MEILTIGNKELKTKAKRIARVDDSVRHLIASMIDTMIQNNGVGLAAPQIGVAKRVIVVRNQENEGVVFTLINPEIVWESSERIVMEEGCLSIPNQSCSIERSKEIIVKFRDQKGKPHRVLFHGWNSRIIQHEIDHLDGKLMVDYN